MDSHLAFSKHILQGSRLERAGNDIGRARIVARAFRLALLGIALSSEVDLLNGVFYEGFGQ